MMNHEDDTIDTIDQLMTQGLDTHGVPLDDYHSNRYDKCLMCQYDWHGTPNSLGCPGAWASEEDRAAYLGGSKSLGVNGAIQSVFEGIVGSVSGLVDLLSCPDVESGTVLAQMPSQIYPPNGEPVHGMLTVIAQPEGYWVSFCPTESDDSFHAIQIPVETDVAQGFSYLGYVEGLDENTDVAP